jgi:RNA polymerase sigma factor (sigma-70 family)
MNQMQPTDLTPTRRSLLTRLKDWDNHDSWQDFFDTYWRLIYSFAIQSGLADAEAQEVVQETLISVAKEFKGFKYDPAKGSFKSWLLLITRRRIADQMRKRYRAREVGKLNPDDTQVAEEINLQAQANATTHDSEWDEAWRTQMAEAALARVRSQVRPEQFQMFEMYVLRGQSGGDVARALGVSLMTVYLAKHRVSALLKKEATRLEKQML